MEPTLPPSLESRRDQLFPTLTSAEIARLHRFGTERSLAAGSALVTAGTTTPGLQVMLSGQASVAPRNEAAVMTYGPGRGAQ